MTTNTATTQSTATLPHSVHETGVGVIATFMLKGDAIAFADALQGRYDRNEVPATITVESAS